MEVHPFCVALAIDPQKVPAEIQQVSTGSGQECEIGGNTARGVLDVFRLDGEMARGRAEGRYPF